MGAFTLSDWKESSDEAQARCLPSCLCEGRTCMGSWELSFPGRRCYWGFLLLAAEGNLITDAFLGEK